MGNGENEFFPLAVPVLPANTVLEKMKILNPKSAPQAGRLSKVLNQSKILSNLEHLSFEFRRVWGELSSVGGFLC